MRKIENKKFITKGRIAIALAVIFVLVLTASVILYFTVWSKDKEPEEKVPPVAQEGEAVLNGSLMAYPLMAESKIQDIVVKYKNDKGEWESYGMSRPDDGGNFELYYEKDGNLTLFHPNICDLDDDFSYSSLYSVEMGDGFGAVTKLKYLCMALMYPYVEERIDLIPEEKAAQLSAYGFSEGEYDTIVFNYLDDEGKEKTHKIQIGDKTYLGTGYYIRVDDRNCVYASYQDQLEYAFAGFYSFVKPIVISPGIKEDTVLSAYLTTNYEQWLNEMHKEPGEITKEGSRVIAYTDVIVPVDRSIKEILSDGYIKDGYTQIEFDLSKYKGKPDYKRLVNALTEKAIGDYDNEIVFTLTGAGGKIDFTSAESFKYEYSVIGIESVLTDEEEISTVGTAVGENNLVKLSYRLKIGGKSASVNILHAVVDLSTPGLPASFVSAIRASSVGTLPSPISLSVDYSKDNAAKQSVKYVITELVSVFDKDGKEISKVTDTSIVTYRYRYMINGVYSEDETLTTLNLGTDTTESGAKVKAALKGKTASREDIEIVVDEYVEYCEYFKDFITYSVSRIDYFITKKTVSKFRFLNKSDRDPYYGESIYENEMPDKHAIYGLNNAVCQKIVNILTGISADSSSAPTGLVGSETVDIGLTPEVMEKYGLYAHTVYFELPRGIYTIDSGSADEIDDYAWYEVLGFTLHISDENEDGTRYVASDLYDIVAKMDAENFVFLKYDFVNFFARREMMLTEVKYITEANFEICYSDVKGLYQMGLQHDNIYIGTDNRRYVNEESIPEGVGVQSIFDEITVNVTPKGECTPSKLTEYMAERNNGSDFVSLTELYNKLTGDGNKNIYAGYDPLGTSNFKKLLENIYSTTYSGVIPEGEQSKILEKNKMLFRMSFKIPESSAWYYVYEFYRYDDGRVMVKLYQASYEADTNTYTPKEFTVVSDFYISNFAFRKIVNNFISLLNVEIIDMEVGYPE